MWLRPVKRLGRLEDVGERIIGSKKGTFGSRAWDGVWCMRLTGGGGRGQHSSFRMYGSCIVVAELYQYMAAY